MQNKNMQEVEEHLYKLRHSLAHVLAQAVLQLRPGAKLAFGPPIETGCYYDFLFDQPLTSEDFPDIEKRMRRIIAEKQEFVGSSKAANEAVEHLSSLNQEFKVEYCKELASQGETEIGFYINGPFEDMCAGPHLKHTGEIPPDCFKIDSLAGAYWRGSEKNPQLTRIYCLAYPNKQTLNDFIKKRELAKERDHRKLGRELELFLISDLVGPGLPLWTPHGTAIKEALEDFAKEREAHYGYQRVSTPHLAKEELFYTSGHLPYYKDTMFPPMEIEGESNYYLKAMNCPHHHQIYNYRPRSYRELPLRLAEYGSVYRFEPSGTLSGLLRVRSLAMNDAHIYCTPEQFKDEIRSCYKLTSEYYNLFRFETIKPRFSTHDPANKEKFVDMPEAWRSAEAAIQSVISELGVECEAGPGEAAFYGPKIDFQASTALGREETLSTIQLDFLQPQRFELKYVGDDGKEHTPFLIHRAPLSTHERFIAFLIEHFGGAFPTWMAPIQAKLIPVAEDCRPYTEELASILKQDLVRVEIDFSSHSFNKKIREAVVHKIPNIVIVGAKEIEERSITLRRYCVKDQVKMPLERFVAYMKSLIATRTMDNFSDVDVSKL